MDPLRPRRQLGQRTGRRLGGPLKLRCAASAPSSSWWPVSRLNPARPGASASCEGRGGGCCIVKARKVLELGLVGFR